MTSITLPNGSARRRRRTLNEPSKKATFQIRESILQEAKSFADEGLVPSMSVLVEQALEEKLRDLKRERLYAAYDEAASNPAFVNELQETTRAFEQTAADGLGEGVKALG